MKRAYRYMIVAFVALVAVGCVSDDADERSSKELGRRIWLEVANDIGHINEILVSVVHLDYMLGLDEGEREAYIAEYLPNLEGNNGRYELTVTTTYNTRYTTTFDTGGKSLSEGGEWRVSSPSGIAYELNIKPKTDDSSSFIATFTELSIAESTGEARLEISFYTDNKNNDKELNEAVVEYHGTLNMIDDEASQEKPLTLTTEIGHITYRQYAGIVAGTMEIICRDMLYETEDRVSVDVSYKPRRVVISCWGEQHTIY